MTGTMSTHRTNECSMCGEEYPANLKGCPWCVRPKRTKQPLVEPEQQTPGDN